MQCVTWALACQRIIRWVVWVHSCELHRPMIHHHHHHRCRNAGGGCFIAPVAWRRRLALWSHSGNFSKKFITCVQYAPFLENCAYYMWDFIVTLIGIIFQYLLQVNVVLLKLGRLFGSGHVRWFRQQRGVVKAWAESFGWRTHGWSGAVLPLQAARPRPGKTSTLTYEYLTASRIKRH